MKKINFVLLILFTSFIFGQVPIENLTELDLQKLHLKAEETAVINPDEAYKIASKLLNNSKKKSEKELAKANSTMAFVKIWQSLPDEALSYNTDSYNYNLKIKNNDELAKNLNQFGSIFQNKSDYVKATKYFLESIKICEKEKLNSLMQHNYRSLCNISLPQEKNDIALKYINKAIAIEKKYPNENDKANNYLVHGVLLSILDKTIEAENSFGIAYKSFESKQNFFKMAATLAEKSTLYSKSNPIRTLEIELQAHDLFTKIAPKHLMAIANYGNIGESYFHFSQNDSLIEKIKNSKIPNSKKALLIESEKIIQECLEISKEKKNAMYISYFYDVLTNLYKYKKDYNKALLYLESKTILTDSLYSQKNKNAIAKLESEKEIIALKTKNEKKATLNKILVASSLALLLIGFLGYRNFRNKRKLQNLKISELEKDKQLLAIDAMLKGQEEERGRIAKDLHDGLGGLLSGTKLSFTNMKENLILTPENATQFEKSLSMLDTTISDLRKVAHNLMPEALVKFGLNEALRDFCNSIQSASNISVDYQKMGTERKINTTAETFIYRIIQELVNNAVKHSNAQEIMVQLTIENNKVFITVEDNGKGYDATIAKNLKGDGLNNIDYRVQYLNGKIDTLTSPNNGTSVNIELNA